MRSRGACRFTVNNRGGPKKIGERRVLKSNCIKNDLADANFNLAGYFI